MLGLVLILLAAFAAATYGFARRRVVLAVEGGSSRPRSLPTYYGVQA